MPKFSKKSQDKLSSCHPLLQEVFNEVIKYVDCTVVEGVRDPETQKEYVRRGVSKTLESKHLKQDDGYSHAVDCVPYPIDWKDKDRFYFFGGIVTMAAKMKGIDIRWGGDWSSDNDFKDQSFHDLPHFELRSTSKRGGIAKAINQLSEVTSETEIEKQLKDLENDLDF